MRFIRQANASRYLYLPTLIFLKGETLLHIASIENRPKVLSMMMQYTSANIHVINKAVSGRRVKKCYLFNCRAKVALNALYETVVEKVC
jgi:hypothetical protein